MAYKQKNSLKINKFPSILIQLFQDNKHSVLFIH